jgi:hypothetical protein
MRFGSALALFAGAAAIVAGGIAVVDFQLQRSDRAFFIQENLAAEAVAQGHAIVFPHGMNESAFRWALAEHWVGTPDIVVLGSSHAQLIASDFFPGQRLCNLSVAGGLFTDDLISSEIIDERHRRPRHWYVFVDPWLFETQSAPHASSRRLELNAIDALLSGAKEAPHFPVSAANSPEAMSSPNTGYGLDPILAAIDEHARRWLSQPVIADGENFQTPVIHADGSLQAEPGRALSPAETAVLAQRQFTEKADRHRYGTYTAFDPGLLNVFTNWIRFLEKDGADVTLVFEPYHPAIYTEIVAEPGNRLGEIDRAVREIAGQCGARVVGDYDPAKAGVTGDDFLDGDHLRTSGLKRVLRRTSPHTGL